MGPPQQRYLPFSPFQAVSSISYNGNAGFGLASTCPTGFKNPWPTNHLSFLTSNNAPLQSDPRAIKLSQLHCRGCVEIPEDVQEM
jgi:hypothetical protein